MKYFDIERTITLRFNAVCAQTKEEAIDLILDHGVFDADAVIESDPVVTWSSEGMEDDTYDEYGVNTKNSFNTPPKEAV